ncbi:MAG: hypothetical protein OEW83_19415, partial [Acidimicrobiia bacterium]|nr:hypothetical protein [Acidimicrobiia bacterium]
PRFRNGSCYRAVQSSDTPSTRGHDLPELDRQQDLYLGHVSDRPARTRSSSHAAWWARAGSPDPWRINRAGNELSIPTKDRAISMPFW